MNINAKPATLPLRLDFASRVKKQPILSEPDYATHVAALDAAAQSLKKQADETIPAHLQRIQALQALAAARMPTRDAGLCHSFKPRYLPEELDEIQIRQAEIGTLRHEARNAFAQFVSVLTNDLLLPRTAVQAAQMGRAHYNDHRDYTHGDLMTEIAALNRTEPNGIPGAKVVQRICSRLGIKSRLPGSRRPDQVPSPGLDQLHTALWNLSRGDCPYRSALIDAKTGHIRLTDAERARMVPNDLRLA